MLVASGQRPFQALIRVGLLALVTALLLTALAISTPQGSTARAASGTPATTDTLWAGTISPNSPWIGVCESPASAQSLSACFASATSKWSGTHSLAATDGESVYYTGAGPGLNCPVSGLGTDCTQIMAGPWPSSEQVEALAAADGQLWIGQSDGSIYRCPADLPYAQQNSVPSQCVLLDDAGNRSVTSLLLANGTLYAGLGSAGTEKKNQGLLWTCDPQTTNSCSTLDSYGNTKANTLAAGGGYLWVGLNNGIIWRCDLAAADACTDWDTAGERVGSISYDGNNTLYAAIGGSGGSTGGVIWSCPTTAKNQCTNVVSNVSGGWVAAGAGGVFSSVGSGSQSLRYGTSPYTAALPNTWQWASLIYLPADGPLGVGAVRVKVGGKGIHRLKQRCAAGMKPLVRVRLKARNNVAQRRTFSLCRPGTPKAIYVPDYDLPMFDLLDPGSYAVTARADGYTARKPVTVKKDRTHTVRLRLGGTAKG